MLCLRKAAVAATTLHRGRIEAALRLSGLIQAVGSSPEPAQYSALHLDVGASVQLSLCSGQLSVHEVRSREPADFTIGDRILKLLNS